MNALRQFWRALLDDDMTPAAVRFWRWIRGTDAPERQSEVE